MSNLGYTERASCRVVGLERSTYYYDNLHRVPSNQAIRRLLLRDVIGEVHASSRGTYGRLRVKAALRMEHGLIVNQKLVARIMRDLNIHGLPQRKRVTRNLANVATPPLANPRDARIQARHRKGQKRGSEQKKKRLTACEPEPVKANRIEGEQRHRRRT